MKKNIAISVGCLVMTGMLGCAYEPNYDSYEYGYPIRESEQCALAPDVRWTSLHYYNWSPWGPFLDMWIFPDTHRIKFTQRFLGDERPPINHDRVATADEWNWIAGQLEKAGVSRWKTSYRPDGVEVLDGVVWNLEFLDGTNVVGKATGYNAWPKDFNALRAILDAFDLAENGSCVVFPKTTKEKAVSPQ